MRATISPDLVGSGSIEILPDTSPKVLTLKTTPERSNSSSPACALVISSISTLVRPTHRSIHCCGLGSAGITGSTLVAKGTLPTVGVGLGTTTGPDVSVGG